MTSEGFPGKRTADQANLSYDDDFAKRPRDSSERSKVVFFRSLPKDVLDEELKLLASPFGSVMKIFTVAGKGQAFVQMGDQLQADSLITYYNAVPATVRGRPCHVSYSSRQEITGSRSSSSIAPGNILLVSISNLMYPVTIDVIHQVFSKYGLLLRIVIFQKNGFQTLLEFDSPVSAQLAKEALDGQCIYTGCCNLKIQFSNLTTLTVKANNERSRDFTNPNLPTEVGGAGGVIPGGYPGPTPYGAPALPGIPPIAGLPGMSMPAIPSAGASWPLSSGSAVVIVGGLHPERTTPEMLFNLFGVYGDVQRVKIMFQKKENALIQFSSTQQADLAIANLNGCPLLGNLLRVNMSKHTTVSTPRDPSEPGADLTQDYSNSPHHRFKRPGSKNYSHIVPPTPVLHLSNLPTDDSVDEEKLQSLFSQYGSVTSFRFLNTTERHMALVQMSSVEEAVHGLVFLHNYDFGGKNMKVSFSKSTL